ncbi:MAG TPA: hypothetical protein VGM90_17385 [Kofleriaceae bacterium]|jgi:hypothetical protein
MIEVEVRGDTKTTASAPEALAELINATLVEATYDQGSAVAATSQRVREEQVQAQLARPSWQDMQTVPFETLDDDEQDWTEV